MDGAEVAIVAGALLMRVLVGLSPYSGFNDPPKYGDYEAQRHWMELALGLPPRQWYDDGAEALARLEKAPPPAPPYWPLDYPPLSGYQSWLTGLVVRAADPAAVALGARSRGHEGARAKLAMRLTVLLCDAAVFFPAAFSAARALAGWASTGDSGSDLSRFGRTNDSSSSKVASGSSTSTGTSSSSSSSSSHHRLRLRRRAVLAALLLNPALVLVDHGHFQYNCISLGLALAAMAALVTSRPVVRAVKGREDSNEEQRQRQRPRRPTQAQPQPPPTHCPLLPRPRLIAAVLFSLSLCHKQMGLYYAPAFFAHMLGACLEDQPTWPRRAAAVAALGAAVAATLAAAFFPVVWGHRQGLVGGVGAVLSRIFPLRRGLYEDYVANFWCATSVGPLKWRELLGGGAARVALAATVAAALPAMAQQVAAPSRAGFLLCCANSAAAFFLFSFQVHEKSVLLPLMPATLLLFALGSSGGGGGGGGSGGGDSAPRSSWPLLVLTVWGPVVACFGMFPLLERDGVSAAYAACLVAYVAIAGGLVDEALAAGPPPCDHHYQQQQRRWRPRAAVAASVGGALALHAARLAYDPPARLPWLHDRLFVTYAFVFVALGAAYLNWVQWGAWAWAWAWSAAAAAAAGRKGAGGGGGGGGRRGGPQRRGNGRHKEQQQEEEEEEEEEDNNDAGARPPPSPSLRTLPTRARRRPLAADKEA